ncbi:unnamed protein product [Anisakis simplex]|uniref:HintC domain-containing protein n=1 Tax=Anisakis simplex TaxID=6269 RepID=A0A0M3KFY9_ANISI|nr:unnamed protein product [Anisakis simplex]
MKCGTSLRATAKRSRTMSVVILPKNAGFRKDVITSITEELSQGIYAPMTATGHLIVNNVYASCHNIVRSTTLVHTFLYYLKSVENRIRHFLKNWWPHSNPVSVCDLSNETDIKSDERTDHSPEYDLPFGSRLLLDLLDYFVVIS